MVFLGASVWERIPASQSWILGPTVLSPSPASLQSLPQVWGTLEPRLLARSTWPVAPPSLGLGAGGSPSSQLDQLRWGQEAECGQKALSGASQAPCHHSLCMGFTLCPRPVLSHHIPPGGVAGSQVHLVPKVRMKGSGHWSPLVTPSPNSASADGYLISQKLLRAREKKAGSVAKQAGAFNGGERGS